MGEIMQMEDHIRKNKRDTVFICIFMIMLLFGTISGLGFLIGSPPIISLSIGLPLAIVYVLITYNFSVKSVLSAAAARPADPRYPDEKMLIYKVEEMSIAAGLPMPKVYVQDSDDINAFATGKKPEEAVICCTKGALALLDQHELEGVMAHEMSHIKNHDILIATVTVGVVGAIALMAEIVLRAFWWGSIGSRGRNNDAFALIIAAAILIGISLFLSKLTHLWISRKREFLADASGAMLTRNPEGLASALEKIRGDILDDPKGSKTVASLYIENPFKRTMKNSLWSTHPPIDERIARLRSM
jgi:heat shock protein HtpX